MKVTVNMGSCDTFNSLSVGDVFAEIDRETEYYIKVSESSSPLNAFNITRNTLEKIIPSTLVKSFTNVELIITD